MTDCGTTNGFVFYLYFNFQFVFCKLSAADDTGIYCYLESGKEGQASKKNFAGQRLGYFSWLLYVLDRDPSAFSFPYIDFIWPWKIIARTVDLVYNHETTSLDPVDQIKHIMFLQSQYKREGHPDEGQSWWRYWLSAAVELAPIAVNLHDISEKRCGCSLPMTS